MGLEGNREIEKERERERERERGGEGEAHRIRQMREIGYCGHTVNDELGLNDTADSKQPFFKLMFSMRVLSSS